MPIYGVAPWADLNNQLYRKQWQTMAKIGYSVQGLVAKMKDTVAND